MRHAKTPQLGSGARQSAATIGTLRTNTARTGDVCRKARCCHHAARVRYGLPMISARVRLFIPALLLAGCSATAPLPAAIVPTPAPPLVQVAPVNVRIGIALGGGAAKGFAHIGVIKMLEANGLIPEVVAGTSAGSLVGALYASGMDVFRLQQNAVALDETGIRDMSLFSGGLIKGQRLQDYVNEMVGQRPFQRLPKRFAVVATRLDTGARTVFARGNVGQAVRASCSIPGLFEPARIGNATYVDGGLVSPVPVDAARELGARSEERRVGKECRSLC